MIWIAALLLAAMPHVSNPWAVSALIGVSVILIAFYLKYLAGQVLQQLGSNQKKIYQKIS
jgi:hypothetical protein